MLCLKYLLIPIKLEWNSSHFSPMFLICYVVCTHQASFRMLSFNSMRHKAALRLSITCPSLYILVTANWQKKWRKTKFQSNPTVYSQLCYLLHPILYFQISVHHCISMSLVQELVSLSHRCNCLLFLWLNLSYVYNTSSWYFHCDNIDLFIV